MNSKVIFLIYLLSLENCLASGLKPLDPSNKSYIEVVQTKSWHAKVVYKLLISNTSIYLEVCRYKDGMGKVIDLKWRDTYYYGTNHHGLQRLHRDVIKEARLFPKYYSALDGGAITVKFWDKDKFVEKKVSRGKSTLKLQKIIMEIEKITGIASRRLSLPKEVQKAYRDGKVPEKDQTDAENPFED